MDTAPPKCIVGNGYNGHMGARISAIFVILIGSMLGLFHSLLSHALADCIFKELGSRFMLGEGSKGTA
jgi:hypothetical protein